MKWQPPIPAELWDQVPPAAQAAILALILQYEQQLRGGPAAPTALNAANGSGAGIAELSGAAGTSGFGLAGIAERVASCGGNLTVGPARAGGFAVTARLPTP